MRYHNFSESSHTLPYIFSQLNILWGYLQRVITRYRQIYKRKYINIFLENMLLTHGSASQIAQNQVNLRKDIW